MGKPIHHRLDVYGTHLHLATDRRALATLRRQLPELDKGPHTVGGSTIIGNPEGATRTTHLVIWIDVDAHHTDDALVDTIAHESTHAGALLLDHIGQAYDGDSEALAYLVGFIAGWTWRGCKTP